MTVIHYDPSLTMREARAEYFAANHFGADGGYNDPWVDFKIGPVPLPFPNSASRVRALRFHDMHHILTGYDTTFIGELEIGAWELAAGCHNEPFAWFINLSAMGAFLASPRRIFRAFVRGLRSQSLYGQDAESLLSMQVRDVRTKLSVPSGEVTSVKISELAQFCIAVGVGFVVGLAALAVFLPLSPIGIVVLNLRRRAASKDALAT
ncbi:MAG: hypothetical protein U0745_08985 [Polyangia bacterium]|jgi:hypothetical protein